MMVHNKVQKCIMSFPSHAVVHCEHDNSSTCTCITMLLMTTYFVAYKDVIQSIVTYFLRGRNTVICTSIDTTYHFLN